jgi:hypothetical protein
MLKDISKTELQLKSKASFRKLHSSSKQKIYSNIRASWLKRYRPNRSLERRRHREQWRPNIPVHIRVKSSSRHISDLKFSDVWNKISDNELYLWNRLMDESHHVDSTRNEHVGEATP